MTDYEAFALLIVALSIGLGYVCFAVIRLIELDRINMDKIKDDNKAHDWSNHK